MALSDLASIATIAEAIFVIVSVFLIWHEVRENTKLTKAANTQALVELSSPFNMQLIQDRKMAEFWVQGAKEFAQMDEVDRYRYNSLLVWWLILHENIYYQWRKGLLDNNTYEVWARDLENFVSEQNLELYWGEMKIYVQSEFANRIHQLIEKLGARELGAGERGTVTES